MFSHQLPRVLVVDDNPDNANIVRQYLEVVWGYPITVAYDGDEALDAFERIRPGIVLLDVMMPGRNGWEVCKAMKAHPEWGKWVRVIMVTALDDISDRSRASEIGADDFVEKPFGLTKLAATVQRNVVALETMCLQKQTEQTASLRRSSAA